MRKKSRLLFIISLLLITMSALPVLASDSGTNKKVVESNPELSVPSTQRAKSKLLKTASAPVKLDSEQIGQTSAYDDIIFEKEGKGVYFLKKTNVDYSTKYEVVFYDLESQTYKSVYTTESLSDYYVNNNAIYFLTSTRKTQKDDTTTTYLCSVTIDKYDFAKGTSSSVKLENIVMSSNWYHYIESFGVDNSERMYLATADKEIQLFNAAGKYLSKTSTSDYVEQFCGFDPVNGNFYYRSSYNWVYWGYNHDMSSLMAGNVQDNVIQVKDTNMMILYQNSFYEHQNPVMMLNDRYLASLSTFNSNIGLLLDSNAYDYTDVTQQSTSIDMITSNVSVSLINIANKEAVPMAFKTASSEYQNYRDITSIGTRCALNDDASSLVVKTDSNVLTEYDMNAKEEKIRLQTKHPVYTFALKGERCIIIERDGNDFYLESVDWTYPTDIEVDAPSSMTVGSSGKISCVSDNDSFKLSYTYESSDSSVVSVDSKGKLNAFKAGKVSITIKASPINVVKKVDIVVEESELSGSDTSYKTSDVTDTVSGITHSNASRGYYGTPQTAYLTPLKNGTYERVEYINSKIIREVYDSSFKLQSTSEIPFELSRWGGYFSGQDYNFLLFGEKNLEEDDEQEVYRIVKYDKNWNRLGTCSIKGANTYVPFDAGSADMTETNGKLYIHTCHTMYKSSNDGLNHQANCTFVVDESSLELVDSCSVVANIKYSYVSHSFSQKIATDGSYIYRADLGDAYPRGIAFTVTDVNEKINAPSIYGSVIDIPGSTGANYTGFTLDALQLSEDYYMLAGTGIKEQGDSVKNIYINAGPKNSAKSGAVWITNYSKSDNIQVLCPKLIALNQTQFLLMWEEKGSAQEAYTTKMVLMNEDGQKVSDIYSTKLALSKCDPVINNKGTVVWYVTTENGPVFVEVNPYQLSKVSTSTGNLTIFHKHKWDAGKVTKEAACTEDGERTYTCTTCGETEKEVLPATGHNWANVSIPDSTDTQCECTKCKETKPHSLEVVSTKDATCTTAAVITYQCTDCKYTVEKEDSEHPALGHDWKNEEGKCSRCDASHSHNWKEEVTKEATCTEDGEKVYTCEECGFERTEIIAAGHVWGEWKTTKEPTCTEAGEQTRYCANCDETETKELPLIAHNKKIVNQKEATCAEEGYTGDEECTQCHEIFAKGEVIPRLTVHTWNEGEVTKPATCTEAGEKMYTCSICKLTKTEVIAATGHDWGEWKITKAVTCTSAGEQTRYCNNCEETETKVLSATGHKWDKGKVTKQPTYKATGIRTYTCAACKQKRTEKIPAIPLPSVGTRYKVNGNTYKVTKAGAEVSLIQATAVAKTFTVPKTITAGKITYKVTSIGAKAFKNNKKLKNVTIGANITKIANNAFYKCKVLKTVKINTVKLTKKTASKKAFNGVAAKMVIKVPKKVKNSYGKIFKGLTVKS